MADLLTRRTIGYSLAIRALGTSRRVAPSLIGDLKSGEPLRTATDRTRIRASKRILESDEVAEIRSIDTRLRAVVRARSVPYPLRAGIYLIPVELVAEVDREVERLKPLRSAAVEALARAVDRIRESDRALLADLFDAGDYPSPDEIRAAYTVETRYVGLDLPQHLESVSGVYARERERISAELTEAAEAIRQVQRAELLGLVRDIGARLAPGPDGKRKVLRPGGPLDAAKEFLEMYGALNVADDKELPRIVEQARALLEGADPAALKSDAATAEALRAGLGEIGKALEPLVGEAPRRRFRASA